MKKSQLKQLIKKEILNEIGVSFPLRVYAPIPNNDLYKLEYFSEKDLEKLLYILDRYFNGKLDPSEYMDEYKYEGQNIINFDGNFSKPLKISYLNISGDGTLYFVDSLSKFSEGWQTEEEWGIENWKLIR